MNDREKYRTRGLYFLFRQDAPKAVEEFSALVHQYPLDHVGYANLALAYLYLRDMPRTLEAQRKAIEINHDIMQRDNAALYAMYAGEFAESERDAQGVLHANPSFEKAYIALGLSELAQGRPQKSLEFYRKLQSISKLGAAFAVNGLADVALYEGKTSDATALLEGSIAAAGGESTDTSIAELTKLAQTYSLRHEFSRAMAAAERALSMSDSPAVLFMASRVYLDAGQSGKALALSARLARRLEVEPRAYAKLIEGEGRLKLGAFAAALDAFQESRKLTDTWMAHFDMGRAYLGAHSPAQASSEFDLCLKRRGEATALFLDEIPTYWLLPPVYYYMGLAQEELKSPGGAESFRTYISVREGADYDPLLAEARQRLGHH
jgi:tetratricopeptide (TPR) repeat protein